MKKIFEVLKSKKKAYISVPYVIFILACLVFFLALLAEFNNATVVKNLETASDLAAVEALRKYVDEDKLKNEELYISPEKYLAIRDDYLENVRKSVIFSLFHIQRIEVTSIEDGKVVLPADYSTTGIYPYSKNLMPDGSYASNPSVDFTPRVSLADGRDAWFLGSDNLKDASISIVRDRHNIQTSGTKEKTSYVMTVRTTVVYKSIGRLSKLVYSYLSSNDIFDDADTKTTIITYQEEKGMSIVTIETVAKVTLS